jgi:hypothetical protein
MKRIILSGHPKTGIINNDPAPLTVRFLGVLLSDEHIAFQTPLSDSGSTCRRVSRFGHKRIVWKLPW